MKFRDSVKKKEARLRVNEDEIGNFLDNNVFVCDKRGKRYENLIIVYRMVTGNFRLPVVLLGLRT